MTKKQELAIHLAAQNAIHLAETRENIKMAQQYLLQVQAQLAEITTLLAQENTLKDLYLVRIRSHAEWLSGGMKTAELRCDDILNKLKRL